MKQSFVAWIAAMLFLTACQQAEGGLAGMDSLGDAVADVESIALSAAFDKAHQGKLVQVEGYLQLPKSMIAVRDTAQIDLYERPDQRRGQAVTAKLAMGDCSNCMARLPASYTRNDLKIRDKNGAVVQVNERVRLTGRLLVSAGAKPAGKSSATLAVTNIEKLAPVAIDYHALSPVVMQAATIHDSTLGDGQLSFAEGRLSMPTMVFIDGDLSLSMAVGKESMGVNFLFGTGPNQIEELPENFTSADLKIHDHLGKTVNFHRAIKLWGARSMPDGVLYVEHVEQ